MPQGLRRYHQSGHSHFVTFSCYRRQPNFSSEEIYDLFPECLERMRRRFDMCIYGYVVMPEHVHLLPSEPERGTLADALHYLKLSFSKRVKSASQLSVQPKDAKLGPVTRTNSVWVPHSGIFCRGGDFPGWPTFFRLGNVGMHGSVRRIDAWVAHISHRLGNVGLQTESGRSEMYSFAIRPAKSPNQNVTAKT